MSAIQAALARIDRVLAVRRWTLENFWSLPEDWRTLALAKNGDTPAPLGYGNLPPKPSGGIDPLPIPKPPPPEDLADA